MTKNHLFLSFVLFITSVFADCDTCSAYKTQVVNDCTAINNALSVTILYAEEVKAQSNYLVSHLSSSDFVSQNKYNNTVAELNAMSQNLTQIRGRLEVSQDYLSSIKNTAQSLVCSTNSVGSCDCAPLLEDLISDLAALSDDVSNILGSETNQESILYNISQVLIDIRSTNNGISNNVSRVYSQLTDCYAELTDISVNLSNLSSKITTIYNVFNANFWQFRDSHLTGNPTLWSTSQYHFLSYNQELGQAKTVMQNVIVADDFLRWLAQNFPLAISSLNNYQFANYTNNAVVNRYLDHIEYFVSAPPQILTNIVNNLSYFGNFFTNTTNSARDDWPFTSANVAARVLMSIVTGENNLDYVETDTMNSGWYDTALKSSVDRMNFKDMVVNFSKGHFRLLTSLNNYSFSSLKSFDKVVDSLQSVTNAISSIERKFSLFTSSLYESDTPLKYYDGNGSYHDYLTNYYIRLSEGQQSGTETFTNWFNRIEILLAALVFQDSQVSTNSFSDSVSTSTIDQSKQTADNSINQILQSSSSYLDVVNTSGQSLIGMVSSWNESLKTVAKPEPFVICEFGGVSASEQNFFSFPTDNPIISSLIDIGHGISTLCWITAFLFFGWSFSRWVISKIAWMISFAYDVYTAIFGGK